MRTSPAKALAESKHPKASVYVVPSVIVPQENNVVLYPAAAGFQAVVIKVEPFRFDPRLFRLR